MIFSALALPFQKPASPAFASRPAMRSANPASSKTPPGTVDLLFQFSDGRAQFVKQHNYLVIVFIIDYR
jgi:hypothetical protein